MTGPSAGSWLKGELSRHDLSPRQVATAIGVSTQAVYLWLADKTSPNDDAAAKLADLLHLPEVEVRHRFGLWVPEEASRPNLTVIDTQALVAHLTEELAERQADLRVLDALEKERRFPRGTIKLIRRTLRQEIERLEISWRS